MKTPIFVLFTAIVYWLIVFSVTMVPTLFHNYYVNLAWIVLVIPNVLRVIVGSIPRLAVDRLFFLSTTIIAFILTFIANKIWGSTRDAVKDFGGDRGKTLKLSAVLMTAFATGALITYFVGIDKSIYSNMGWESNNQGLTM